jgi:hypothetical protein
MATGNFTNSPTNFVIMELGVASSQESHFVVKKMHIYILIIKKFNPKKKNVQDVDPSLIQHAQIFFARIPLELNRIPLINYIVN